MPDIAPVILTDAESSPVDHTFAPADIKDGVAKYQDRSGGVPIGYPTVTFSVRDASKTNPNTKVVLKLVDPKLNDMSPNDDGFTPSPTVANACTLTVEGIFPGDSTLQARKNILAMLVDALGTSQFKDCFWNLEHVY